MAWSEDRRITKFFESIIKGRNRNRLIGPRNLSPRLNGAAYIFEFSLKNISANTGFLGPKATSLHE
jgi:hypothetical protein